MTGSPRIAHTHVSFGDSAVDGLLAGAGAGLLMAVYLTAAGVVSGQSLAAILAQFDPSPDPSPATGALAHLAVAGVYGVIFALAWNGLRRIWPVGPGWLAGLVYGVLLWGVALLLLRLPGGATPESWLAGVAPIHLAVAHWLYGLVLGWLLGRRVTGVSRGEGR
jgi:hypothetical protein